MAKKKTTTKKPAAPANHIGLIGLAVMGQNLVLNMADHNYKVAVYNRSPQKTDAFMTRCQGEPLRQPRHRLQGSEEICRQPRAVRAKLCCWYRPAVPPMPPLMPSHRCWTKATSSLTAATPCGPTPSAAKKT